MRIFDAHCDVLWQMWEEKKKFKNDASLHVTYESLKETGGKIQCMALYIPEKVRAEHRFDVCLEMIDIFYRDIIGVFPDIKLILTKEDIHSLRDDEIGVILTLEGCDAIGNSMTRLRTLHHLGVRCVGLTWNYGNAVADGVLETRGAGLSEFGRKVVEQNNMYHMWTDVSHVCEQGFWDVMEAADYPIASHSNVYTLCNHPRNLSDNQINALLKKDGMIGMTFVPQFLVSKGEARVGDVLRHLDYICSLGGEFNVGFGSDFDGITETVVGLSSFRDYSNLRNELGKYYSEEQVQNFCYDNFIRHLMI